MFGIIDTRKIKTGLGMQLKNVCLKNGKELVFHCDGYYYLSKDGLTVTKRRYKFPEESRKDI